MIFFTRFLLTLSLVCIGSLPAKSPVEELYPQLRSVDIETALIVTKIIEDMAGLDVPIVTDEETVVAQLQQMRLPNEIATRAVINALLEQLDHPENAGWKLKFYTIFAKFFAPSRSWPSEQELTVLIGEASDTDAVFSAEDSPRENLIVLCQDCQHTVNLRNRKDDQVSTWAAIGAGSLVGALATGLAFYFLYRRSKGKGGSKKVYSTRSSSSEFDSVEDMSDGDSVNSATLLAETLSFAKAKTARGRGKSLQSAHELGLVGKNKKRPQTARFGKVTKSKTRHKRRSSAGSAEGLGLEGDEEDRPFTPRQLEQLTEVIAKMSGLTPRPGEDDGSKPARPRTAPGPMVPPVHAAVARMRRSSMGNPVRSAPGSPRGRHGGPFASPRERAPGMGGPPLGPPPAGHPRLRGPELQAALARQSGARRLPPLTAPPTATPGGTPVPALNLSVLNKVKSGGDTPANTPHEDADDTPGPPVVDRPSTPPESQNGGGVGAGAGGKPDGYVIESDSESDDGRKPVTTFRTPQGDLSDQRGQQPLFTPVPPPAASDKVVTVKTHRKGDHPPVRRNTAKVTQAPPRHPHSAPTPRGSKAHPAPTHTTLHLPGLSSLGSQSKK